VHLLDIKLEVDRTRAGLRHAKLHEVKIVKSSSSKTQVSDDAIRVSSQSELLTPSKSLRGRVQWMNMILSIECGKDGCIQTYRGSRPEFALKDSQT